MTDAKASSSKPSLSSLPTTHTLVSLVGFMGAGKTTVGRALAAKLGWRFYDLDDLIQAQTGRTIEEIFRQDGEKVFRELEASVLRDTLRAGGSDHLVLALGGGAFVEEAVSSLLREAGVPAVCLDAPVEELFRRCEQPGIVRPLRRNLQQFSELYEKRRPSYLKATLCVATGGKDVDSVVDEIITGLNLVPAGGVSA